MPQLVHEFAIDPDSILSISDLRYLDEATGWKKGRLISEFPEEWRKVIVEKLKQRGFPEKKADELLILLKRKSGRFGRPKKLSSNWIDDALIEHNKKPFQAIISHTNEELPEFVLNFNDLKSDLPLWNVPTTASIPREAKQIASVFSLVLKYSPSVYLIDPHFDPKASRFRKPFQAICQASLNESSTQAKKIEYHLKRDGDAKTWIFRKECV